LLREVPGPGGAEAVVDAVADAREAVQLMGVRVSRRKSRTAWRCPGVAAATVA
jgi:hypothetical protein